MEDYRLITMQDLEDVELQKWIDTIKEKNALLYKNIMRCLKKENFKGMRDDVLQCLAGNADKFQDDKNVEVAFQIADLIQDQRIEPEDYEWLIAYWNTSSLAVSDVIVLFMMALDKKIPLEEIKLCFEGDNEMAIFERIEGFDCEEQPNNSVTAVANMEKGAIQVQGESKKIKNENAIVSVFSDLLTVMSSEKQPDDNAIVLFQKKFAELMTCLQNNVNEVNAFVGEIIHEWENDKEEVRRLRAIYNIQQNVLARKQQNLYEAEDEISRLQTAVYEAEKMELHYETINQKIEEIKKLTATSLID